MNNNSNPPEESGQLERNVIKKIFCGIFYSWIRLFREILPPPEYGTRE